LIFRNIDASGDWVFGRGIGSYAAGNQAIALNIKTRILSWIQNCFFDLGAGIDWSSRLDRGQEQNLLNDLQAIISQSDGVVAIKSISAALDRLTRRLSVSYDVSTIYTQSFAQTLEAAVGLPGA
jgi:hypothetical protein